MTPLVHAHGVAVPAGRGAGQCARQFARCVTTDKRGRGFTARADDGWRRPRRFRPADASFAAGTRRLHRGRCPELPFPPRCGRGGPARCGGGCRFADQASSAWLKTSLPMSCSRPTVKATGGSTFNSVDFGHDRFGGGGGGEGMPPQFIRLDGVAGQRHDHRAAERERQHHVQNLLVAEHQHGLVHGRNRFFQPEVRRVAGAEEFGREHVVALEHLHDLAVADGGLFEEVDQLAAPRARPAAGF